MAYKRIKQPKISDVIAEQLEGMIIEGTLKPGQKLLAERELAKQFEVSRPSLREALQKLEAKGLLESRQGGGTFVSAEIGASFTEPLFDLLAKHHEFSYDLLEFRHAMEGISAYYAALRGTDTDKARIQNCYDELLKAHASEDGAREAKADAEFHMSIAEAAHNAILLHIMRGLLSLLQQSIELSFETLYTKNEVRAAIPAQHESLLRAILNSNPQEAREAAHHHIAFVEESLQKLNQEKSRIDRSLRRIAADERT